jgi:hypothetical protein
MTKVAKLTKAQARMICEAHEIPALLQNEEECELLVDNNPELYEAYCALMAIAGWLEEGAEDD